jgi:hypothetical protein
MRTYLINAVITVLIVASSLAAYEVYVRAPRTPGPTRFGVVDIGEVLQRQQAALYVKIVDDKLPVEERKKLAEDGVRNIGNRLESVLIQLTKECGCVVLNKGAVAAYGTGFVDLTPVALERLGIAPQK